MMHYPAFSFFVSLLVVISGCELLDGGVEECEGSEGGDKSEGGEGTERRLRVLERVLKTLENVSFKFVYYVIIKPKLHHIHNLDFSDAQIY